MNELDIEDDCIQTIEDVEQELEALEVELAIRFGLLSDVRTQLSKLAHQGKLEEDEVVARWLRLYSIYYEWSKEKNK